jgi:hypothetical protein
MKNMKSKFLFFCFMFLSVMAFPNEYHKMITDKNHWNYINERYPTCIGCGGETKTHSYFISGDTIIGKISYQKIMCAEIRYSGIDTMFFCAAREDTVNQIVYYNMEYTNWKESELYSFKVDSGERLSLDTIYIGTKLSTITERYVKSVDTYNFNGFTGKKITVATVIKSSNMNFIPYERSVEVWYEGIGCLENFFGIGDDSGILCFWNDGNQIYSNPEKGACVITEYIAGSGINQTEIEPFIRLIPNPVKNILKIESNEDFEYAVLYNLFGCKLIGTTFPSLDLSGFNDGVYLLKIKLKSGQIVNEKIIKNNL